MVDRSSFYSPRNAPLTEPVRRALLDSPLPFSTITFDAATGARHLQELGAQLEKRDA
jgi:hypothetical protein